MEAKKGYSFVEEEQPEESLPAAALRNVVRTGVEIAGTPARIVEGAYGLAKAGERQLGKASGWLKSKVGIKQEEPVEEEVKVPFTPEHIKSMVSGILPKDYLEAKTPGEKFSDEFFSDLTSFAMPIAGMAKLPIKRALAVSGLSNLASWGAKEVGASEGTQNGIKLGTMLATTMAGKGKLNAVKKEVYDSAEGAIPKGTMVSNKLAPISNKWKLAIEKGASDTPAKEFIKKRLENIQANTVRGKINLENVVELKKDWNEIKHTTGVPRRAKHAFNEMYSALHDMIKDYGSTNPEFYKPWLKAEDIHKGLTTASAANRFMQKHLTPLRIGGAAASLMLGHSMGLPHGVGAGAAALAGSVTAKYGVKAFEALKNSKEIRKYYADVVGSAVKKDSVALVKSAKKLDKAVEEEIKELEPKNGFSFVD